MPKSDEFRKRDESPVYLTEDGFVRLKEKLARLKTALPDLAEETARTAAYGDRSENAEYKEAKSTLRRTKWQILSIEDQLKRVVVIKSVPNTSGRVELGSTVVLEADSAEKTFQIVGPQETDPAQGRISHKSPLGSALMNRSAGDVVTTHSSTGRGDASQIYRIIAIR